MAKYVESKVDAMRAQKDEELERYKKEKESEKWFEALQKQKVEGKSKQPIVIKKNVLKKQPEEEQYSPAKQTKFQAPWKDLVKEEENDF